MVQKRLISVIRLRCTVVLVCVLLVLSAPGAALASETTAAALPSETTALRVKAPTKARRAVKSGWAKEGGYWYHYTNGNAATGWKKISGKWYYFDPEDKYAYSTEGTRSKANTTASTPPAQWLPTSGSSWMMAR